MLSILILLLLVVSHALLDLFWLVKMEKGDWIIPIKEQGTHTELVTEVYGFLLIVHQGKVKVWLLLPLRIYPTCQVTTTAFHKTLLILKEGSLLRIPKHAIRKHILLDIVLTVNIQLFFASHRITSVVHKFKLGILGRLDFSCLAVGLRFVDFLFLDESAGAVRGRIRFFLFIEILSERCYLLRVVLGLRGIWLLNRLEGGLPRIGIAVLLYLSVVVYICIVNWVVNGLLLVAVFFMLEEFLDFFNEGLRVLVLTFNLAFEAELLLLNVTLTGLSECVLTDLITLMSLLRNSRVSNRVEVL